MRRSVIFIVVLSFVGLVLGATVFSEVSAVPSTNRVTLKWVTKSEAGVANFLIMRSNDDVIYISLAKTKSEGPGTQYQYVDQNVMFRDFSPLFYKVRAVNSAGQTIEESSMIVHPNISGIFKTWGAIKALFR